MTVAERADATGWDAHLLLLAHPAATADGRAAVTRWARRGVERDAKFVAAQGPETPTRRALWEALQQVGGDAATAGAAGRIAVLPAADFYAPTGPAVLLRQAEAEGHPSVRLLGREVEALSAVGTEGYHRFEAELDRLCTTGHMSALCEYDYDDTTGPHLDQAAARHPAAVHAPHMRATAIPGGLLLAGEIDMDNAHVLAAALHTALQQPAPTFWLDLRETSFFAAEGYRALITATADFRHAGGEVLVAAPRPNVERVLRLLDIDQTPNLALA